MTQKIICMIPARMGSQRLKQKNLRLLNGIPLITHAIRKAKQIDLFSEIWVNSESDIIGQIAEEEGVNFHNRPKELAGNQSTSEDFIFEFLSKHECKYLVQLHTIAPLLSIDDIYAFVEFLINEQPDVLLSYEPIQIECVLGTNAVNFSYDQKTNSQELEPVKRISWSITAWHSQTFINAINQGLCATYYGKIEYFPIDKLGAHVIKTKSDLKIARLLLKNNN